MSGGFVNFQVKSNKKIPLIPGTRTCVGKSQTLISSGVVSLDCILGGGFALSDIILVEEDEFGFYGQLLIKYFISEGVVCGHSGFLASLDMNTNKMVSELPAPVFNNVPMPESMNVSASSSVPAGADVESKSADGGPPVDLKIAWRYHDVPVVQSAPSTVFGHQFDLAKQMPLDMINNAELFHWKPSHEGEGDYYNNLCKVLLERLSKGGHQQLDENKPVRRTVLRIAIHSAGSPMWGLPFDLPKFFVRLRSILNKSLAVCLITVPSRIIQAAITSLAGENCNIHVINRCQHMSDCAFRLESLSDNDDPAYAEYSGLLYLNKLSSKNRLAPHLPETSDWAFKLRKRRFIIEKLHLPPELGETAQREQDESVLVNCGTSSKSNLDF